VTKIKRFYNVVNRRAPPAKNLSQVNLWLKLTFMVQIKRKLRSIFNVITHLVLLPDFHKLCAFLTVFSPLFLRVSFSFQHTKNSLGVDWPKVSQVEIPLNHSSKMTVGTSC
jgi:hypothetical protein